MRLLKSVMYSTVLSLSPVLALNNSALAAPETEFTAGAASDAGVTASAAASQPVSPAAIQAAPLTTPNAAAGTTTAAPAAPAAQPKPRPKPDANGYYVGGPVYVSDKNRIWARSGPSEGYRVVSSHEIGEEMIFRRYSDNGRYAQLEDAEGKTFWMSLESIQPDICGQPQAQKLKSELERLQHRLDNYDNELARRLKDAEENLARTTKENIDLKSTLANKEATINELDELYRDASSRLETKDLDMQMRWWMQGAIIAFCGAVAGVIFVFIPRPTRKQKRERY